MDEVKWTALLVGMDKTVYRKFNWEYIGVLILEVNAGIGGG